ncbi:MAG TPA: hypothetical protein P5137_03550 [Candidatus Brocadiia bacterium]|nr:hypothetical protein [Candidatus Brocadiia bacterium]
MSAYRKAAAVVLLASVLAGCRTAARVEGSLPSVSKSQTIAVLRFNDAMSDTDIWDAASVGRTANPPLGAAVSDAVGAALRREMGCAVLLPNDVARACRERHTSPAEMAALPVAEAARRLGVDHVVIGRVIRYDMRWLLFFSAARLSYEVECLQAGTGAVEWSGSADGCALFFMDENLAADTAAKLAKELAANAKRAAPAAKPAPANATDASEKPSKPDQPAASAPPAAAAPLPAPAPAKAATLPPTKPFKINPQPAN